jgi:hypothetical protein
MWDLVYLHLLTILEQSHFWRNYLNENVKTSSNNMMKEFENGLL